MLWEMQRRGRTTGIESGAPVIGVRGSPERGYFVPACVGSGRWADFERCSRIHACGFRMFGERSPNITIHDVWWAFTKHHYTQWILWFWTSKSKDSLCIVMFGERSPNITVHDVWWTLTKHHCTWCLVSVHQTSLYTMNPLILNLKIKGFIVYSDAWWTLTKHHYTWC